MTDVNEEKTEDSSIVISITNDSISYESDLDVRDVLVTLELLKTAVINEQLAV